MAKKRKVDVPKYVDLSKYRIVYPPEPNLPERTSPLNTARELYKVGKSDEEIISVLTHSAMGYGLLRREAKEVLFAVHDGYPGKDVTCYRLWSLIERWDVSSKKYTDRELYEGYYWLVLHTRPYSSFCEGRIERHTQCWRYGMPACIKTAIKEYGVTILEDHKSAGGFTDYLFNWLMGEGIPLLMVDDRTIKCWRDVRRLWEITKAFSVSHKLDDFYYALESYLEPQHQRNLTKFKTQETTKAGQGQDSTLYFNPTTFQFTFKGRKSRPPLSPGYSATLASMLIQGWGNGKPLTQKEMLEKAGRWGDRQDKPLKKDSQWLYDRVRSIREALQYVKVNMPQATQEGYTPPTEPTKFSILPKK